jgi:hypothetical protein
LGQFRDGLRFVGILDAAQLGLELRDIVLAVVRPASMSKAWARESSRRIVNISFASAGASCGSVSADLKRRSRSRSEPIETFNPRQPYPAIPASDVRASDNYLQPTPNFSRCFDLRLHY